MTKSPQSKVLMIDNDASLYKTLAEPLEKLNIELFGASDLSTAMYRFNKQFLDLLIIDISFSELDGLKLIQRFRKSAVDDKKSVNIILTVKKALNKEQSGLIEELGDVTVVYKPINPAPLASVIKNPFKQK